MMVEVLLKIFSWFRLKSVKVFVCVCVLGDFLWLEARVAVKADQNATINKVYMNLLMTENH